MEKKIKIFVFRSGDEQFYYWGEKEKKWCEKYKKYFTIIDDGNTPIKNNPFETIKLKDLPNPVLNIENRKALEAVGFLSIVNSIDQLDYDYVGFLHMDFMPLFLNEAFFTSNFTSGYPTKKKELFDFQSTIDKINADETEYFFSFQVITLDKAIMMHMHDWKMLIDNKTMWNYCAEKLGTLDIEKQKVEVIKEMKVPICNTILAKKDYWRSCKPFLDNIEEIYNIEKYHKFSCICKKDYILTAHLLEAYNELHAIDYLLDNRDILFQLVPVCHLHH